jgi:hypothetical protein
MAMLTHSVPIGALGCPAGSCREQEQTRPNGFWNAMAAGFLAGALAVGVVGILAGASGPPAAGPADAEARQAAAPARAQLPLAWRYRVQGVHVEGMFRQRR